MGLLNPSIIILYRGFESHSFFQKLKMNFDLALLLFFSICILLNALFIVLGINSIYSIFLLVFLFTLSTGLLLLIECEFMALIFIIIYIGAISVLFLFIILMLDLKTNIKKFYNYLPFINSIILIFLFSFLYLIIDNLTKNYYINTFLFNFNVNWFSKIECMTDLNALGQILYTHFLVQFLTLGLILLLAVIGAVTLTFNINKKNLIFNQSIFRQVSR
jgi:NADH:ubiquinone oxidoreductase subunit 6 (subunit J)